jgi:uncharacterized RDD family membrane protein YckC
MPDREDPFAGGYVGFLPRVLASVVDSFLAMVIIMPVLFGVYGESLLSLESFTKGPLYYLMTWVLPAVAVILFWIARAATPGKMLIKARIVDANTGGKPTTGQLIGRYLGYYVSMLPLFLGFLWIAFDKRKQGWHDKLAHTVVVYAPKKA